MEQQDFIKQRRLRFFKTLSLLSIINICLDILGHLMAITVGKLPTEKIEAIIEKDRELTENVGVEDVYGLFEKMHVVKRLQNENFYLSHGIELLALILGLTGVIYMIKKQIIGFHLYILYSIIITLEIVLYVPYDSIPFPLVIAHALISFLFITLYHRNRTWE